MTDLPPGIQSAIQLGALGLLAVLLVGAGWLLKFLTVRGAQAFDASTTTLAAIGAALAVDRVETAVRHAALLAHVERVAKETRQDLRSALAAATDPIHDTPPDPQPARRR